MKLYCQIQTINEENVSYKKIVKGPCELPQNSEHISNLNLLDDEALKMFGWVPVEQIVKLDVDYSLSEYEIQEDKVIETTHVAKKTPEQLLAEQEKRDFYAWQEIRQQRNILLAETDKLVVIDRWNTLSEEKKDALVKYRQILRDIPTLFKTPSEVIFPTL
jgi:hypothetical protein